MNKWEDIPPFDTFNFLDVFKINGNGFHVLWTGRASSITSHRLALHFEGAGEKGPPFFFPLSDFRLPQMRSKAGGHVYPQIETAQSDIKTRKL
jgi:hypothetical protein